MRVPLLEDLICLAGPAYPHFGVESAADQPDDVIVTDVEDGQKLTTAEWHEVEHLNEQIASQPRYCPLLTKLVVKAIRPLVTRVNVRANPFLSSNPLVKSRLLNGKSTAQAAFERTHRVQL
jgi:hypothetical protein